MTIKLDANINFGYDECADDGINLLALKTNANSSFDFGSSLEGSFLSSTSSLYDPVTPESRNSTPQQLINFDPVFHGENMMFDLIPTPSATYNYFLIAAMAPNTMDYNGMPSTPMRYNIFDTSIPHENLDFTSTQDMELYNLSESLGSSAFLVSSPPQQLNGNLASIWAPYTDGSPGTFSSPDMYLTTPPESSPCLHHYGHNRRRVAIDGPQIKSAILQQHTINRLVEEQNTMGRVTEEDIEQAGCQPENGYHIPHTPTKPRTSKSRSATRKSGNADHDVSRANKGKYKCDILNCPKRYTRAEHLKRHKDGSAHKDNPQLWTCDFCPKNKPFDRADNYRDHLRRHCEDNPGRRINYHPGAASLLLKLRSEMKIKSKKARGSKTEDSDS
ncbi:hypothetical protein N0V93_009336 [Gnomoniopsis smithogilvyi]|uniref:C2H2-type domain-containing protein n=1 Tax=Gnomoniopsis smithogilvyi TaxID=1191159 RepID=A0A9W9CSL4_9PEZI|nr:hypothetical protein N0V93_009336 [Gnomoniopsis smithogilvyi]